MKAVLNCTKLLTTHAYYDTGFIGALGPLIQHTLMTSLCSNLISVVDSERVTKIPTVKCRDKPVSEISEIGKDTLRQAQLKAKRRFCGNDS